MSVKVYNKTADKQFTKHFKLKEMHCHGTKCCSQTKIDFSIVKYAEKMRCALGVPITVSSGYRCTKHNTEVGGAIGSGHTKGTALDLVTAKVSKERLAVLAELIGVPRIGIYPTNNKKYMAHIGLGDKCHWIDTGKYLNSDHSFLNGTWKKPTVSVTPNSNKKYIRWMQGWLFAKGYLKSSIDGSWGPATQKAVDAFRKDNGWKAAKSLKVKAISTLCKTN